MELLVLFAPVLVIGVLMLLPGLERWAQRDLPTRQLVRVSYRRTASTQGPAAPRLRAAGAPNGRSRSMSARHEPSPLEDSTGEEPPLPHDPPPPPGWQDPIAAADVLDDPTTALGPPPDDAA